MKVLVPIKRVVDYNVKIRVKPDQTGVDLANVKMSMNPFDEIGVEEAIRLKEKGVATEIIAVSVGPKETQETIRTALAMGADRGILVIAPADVEPISVAKILAGIAKAEAPQLIILGKQAIDDDCNQTGQMLAQLLGWAQGTFASKVVIDGGKGRSHARSRRRPADGQAGAACDRHDRPSPERAAFTLSLPNIMKAKKKPIDEKTPQDYGVDPAPRLKVLKVSEPPKRKGGVKVKTGRGTCREAQERSGSDLRWLCF
jgi:electron transfer flavoprotein beta subunit